MPLKSDNIILFPKLKTTLEKDSLSALTNKNFNEALTKLNQLLDHGVDHHEIMMGKLICLMELDQFDEAEQLAETLIDRQDTYYYDYLHIYLTILFQTCQYTKLIETTTEELKNESSVPDRFRAQFLQLHDLSTHMKEEIIAEKSAKLMKELYQAHADQRHHRQWFVIEKLRALEALPKQSVEGYLENETVHPVVKTSLFLWYKEQAVNQQVKIQKLGMSGFINPTEMTDVKDSIILKQTQLLINEVEQNDPTSYKWLTQLLDRFIYVRYPLLPEADEAPAIASALKSIGNEIGSIHNEAETDDKVQKYIEEINLCDGLYLSVIDE